MCMRSFSPQEGTMSICVLPPGVSGCLLAWLMPVQVDAHPTLPRRTQCECAPSPCRVASLLGSRQSKSAPTFLEGRDVYAVLLSSGGHNVHMCAASWRVGLSPRLAHASPSRCTP